MEVKAGDTVRLKSGGPIMTVEALEDHERVFCTWMESVKKAGNVSQKKVSDHFAIVTLESAKTGVGSIGVRF